MLCKRTGISKARLTKRINEINNSILVSRYWELTRGNGDGLEGIDDTMEEINTFAKQNVNSKTI